MGCVRAEISGSAARTITSAKGRVVAKITVARTKGSAEAENMVQARQALVGALSKVELTEVGPSLLLDPNFLLDELARAQTCPTL
eukprot:5086154-Prymnesium_polylepis.1